jgi:hypothetical protein
VRGLIRAALVKMAGNYFRRMTAEGVELAF